MYQTDSTSYVQIYSISCIKPICAWLLNYPTWLKFTCMFTPVMQEGNFMSILVLHVIGDAGQVNLLRLQDWQDYFGFELKW